MSTELSRRIRDARKKRGLSGIALAELIGVTPAAVYFWETNHSVPRAENLTALCKALRLPLRATRELAGRP